MAGFKDNICDQSAPGPLPTCSPGTRKSVSAHLYGGIYRAMLLCTLPTGSTALASFKGRCQGRLPTRLDGDQLPACGRASVAISSRVVLLHTGSTATGIIPKPRCPRACCATHESTRRILLCRLDIYVASKQSRLKGSRSLAHNWFPRRACIMRTCLLLVREPQENCLLHMLQHCPCLLRKCCQV